MGQKEIFKATEADAWFQRNKGKPQVAEDPVLKIISESDLDPTSILEIGCGGGARLRARMQTFPDTNVMGIDPSVDAVTQAAAHGAWATVGSAEVLPWRADKFDLVIFGFCLCWCDPADYFSIIREADRVLQDKGHIIIHDFFVPQPYKNTYHHREGLFTHKMDFSQLFLAHPFYNCIKYQVYDGDEHDKRTAVITMQKDAAFAFSENPHKTT